MIECLPFARRPWRDELLDSSVDLVLAIGDHQKQVSALHYERVGTTRLIAVYGAPLRSRLENAAALNFADLQHYQHIYCLPWTKRTTNWTGSRLVPGLNVRWRLFVMITVNLRLLSSRRR